MSGATEDEDKDEDVEEECEVVWGALRQQGPSKAQGNAKATLDSNLWKIGGDKQLWAKHRTTQ